MLNENSIHEYKTVVLVGGQFNNIQVVIEKNEKTFETVVSSSTSWELNLYRESAYNSSEYILQE